MKLENKILAAGLLAEIREYVKSEIAEAKSSSASASRVGDLMTKVAYLEERVRVLEESAAKTKVVRLAA